MAQAWLGLGANIGNPPAQLEEALLRLDQHAQIIIGKRSSLLFNPPWGNKEQNRFLNQVVEVQTSLSAQDLLAACLTIEADMGRIRGEKWGPRLIDIDLIAYQRLEITSENLSLPHPFAHERQFVMSPLREIAPDTASWILQLAEQKREQ
ncbi:2-amino-4-hydroxy-6-hydroxymethyldihydropteridinepyrophosphokinase [hydrothermal vent metagenome]|uniref:2-amino-4-hydroxy-6-hydroxymethyldihydropteridine diphosphokinase n=1 Tax=hydrothermal vent metagenome TaxID=652676 RepID=A0A3B0T682_9ZZZZ